MERHAGDGQFYNWYDHRTGAKLTAWPPTGEPLDADPLLGRQRLARGRACGSSRNSVPQLAARARRALRRDGLRLLLPARRQPHPLPLRARRPATSPCCYDTVVSESRIVDYIGIAKGQLPQKAYYGRWRTFPDTCDWRWQETQAASATTRTYFGVDVFEGALPVRGHAGHAVLGRQHVRGADAVAVRARGALGAALVGRQPPADGARADPPRPRRGRLRLLGLLAVEHARGRLRRLRRRRRSAWTRTATPPTRTTRSSTTASRAAAAARPSPTRRRRRTRTASSRRTPRSWRCATRRDAALANLARLARDFPGLYGKWGFRDTSTSTRGAVSDVYLSLDQGMIMAALGNALGDDVLRRAFADRDVERGAAPGDRGRGVRGAPLGAGELLPIHRLARDEQLARVLEVVRAPDGERAARAGRRRGRRS